MAPRSVLIAVFDGVQSLDITGPLKVFAGANAWLARPGGPGTACPGAAGPAYQISVAGLGGGPVRTSSGLTLLPDADLRAAPAAHTLLVPGGDGSISANEELTAWLRRHAPAAQRIASVCTGAFLLARAGLLAGRKATTHWAYAGTMEQRFPEVDVDPEPIFIRDGNVVTSAGVTAGIDLALALVEEDVDRVRLEAARRQLEDTGDGIEHVARDCGYGTPEAMRRAFVRALGVSPAGYRQRFQAAGRGGRPGRPAARPPTRRRSGADRNHAL